MDAKSASALLVGDAMTAMGGVLAEYAALFAGLGITVDLMEALGGDEESWADFFGGDLAGVREEDRGALVAAVPAIALAAAAAAAPTAGGGQ